MIKKRNIVIPVRTLGVRENGSPLTQPSYVNGGEVVTESNPGWKNPGTADIGGTFLLRRFDHEYGYTGVNLKVGTATYTGQMCASIPQQSMPTVIPDGATKGAEAYNRMKPDKPSFNVLNSLFELREVPDLLKGAFRRGMRSAEDGFLAYEFGIKPLIRDAQKLVTLQRDGQKHLKQLLRDEGRPVRRRVQIKTDMTLTVANYTGYNLFHPVLPAGFYAQVPKATEHTLVTDRIWSSARFRYWLPSGPRDINWTKRMLSRIYGSNLTLETVYNAMPWSWLADWFSDLGDVVSNLEETVVERLAADYFYIMRETQTLVVREATAVVREQSGDRTISCTSQSSRNTKSRLVGDPFGWGTPTSSLSGLQWSILGALGMSRL